MALLDLIRRENTADELEVFGLCICGIKLRPLFLQYC